MDINTCFETTNNLHSIAYYSHLIPIFIAVLLTFFILIKSNYSFLAKTFALFVFGFCFWLLGDVIIWTQSDYNLVNFLWSILDYVNIIFYLFGAYFFAVMVNDKDLSIWYKLVFFVLSLPAWRLTVTNQAITEFYQPVCEALNNEALTQYKLGVEVFVVGFIVIFAIIKFRHAVAEKRKQIVIVATAIILFFTIFSVTEYISSQTGIYEINLYSLFVLPLFLFMIIYSIISLRIFNLRMVATQLLVYILIIMVGSQFMFIRTTINKILTGITLTLLVGFGMLLVKNVKREIEQREKIEKLAEDLKAANVGQASLIHFMNHQIKGRFGNIKNIFAELLTDDYGVMPEETIPLLKKGFDETEVGVNYVTGILKGASAENGTLQYEMKQIDFREIVQNVFDKLKKQAENKGLKINLRIDDGDYKMTGDSTQLWETVKNLVDNAINYTIQGTIDINLSFHDKLCVLKIHDTGVGITAEDKIKLFKAGGRGTNSLKVNVNATGYGLVFVKNVAIAHKGRVWAESAGHDKGSTFYLELPKS